MLAIYNFIKWIFCSNESQSLNKLRLKILVSYEDRDDKMIICYNFIKVFFNNFNII